MSRSDGYELLVFDWDGTLRDSIGAIVACTQATMAELGEGEADAEVIRGAIGLGLREMVDRFAPGSDEELFGRIVQVYRRLWFGGYRDLPELFPSAREVLIELSDQGYLLAVATAKSRRGLDADLTQSGLKDLFQGTRTADEARSKPHPQMILDILGELGVRAEDALMIGDTTHDLQMAHNAGVDAAAVLTGSHDREELSQAAPLVYFDDLRELPGWLVAGRSEG